VEGYESDFLSKVPLEYVCCEELNVKVNLSTISVNTSFKYVVSHIDDLKVASRRISEVETMIKK
jgi:formiminotetrahydrofolate cyclodeaminase